MLCIGMKVHGCSDCVHDKYDLIPVRISDIRQVPDFFSPVNGSTVFPDAYMPHTAQRLHKYKYAAGSVSVTHLPNTETMVYYDY